MVKMANNRSGGGGGHWNKDVLGGKKFEKLTIGGGTIIRDSRVGVKRSAVFFSLYQIYL